LRVAEEKVARRAAIQPAAAALAGWVGQSARNQDVVEVIGEDALREAMAGLLLGAQEVGKAGFADRSMLMRMMGQPWATGSAQQGGGKAAALEMGGRLAAALTRVEKRLAGPAGSGKVVDVEPDGPDEGTVEARAIADLGF
jgi:hypothetical protein